MEYTAEDIKNRVQKEQEVKKLYQASPAVQTVTTATSVLDKLNNNPGAGKLSDIKYTGGFGNVYEKGMDGNYHIKYDNYLGATGNEDRLAKQQSFGEKLLNGVTKNASKLGLYALDGTVGTVVGLFNAIRDGDMTSFYDNDFSEAMDYASKNLDRNFANYYSDEEKSKSFFGKLLTANFWTNDFLNGVAFIGGALLPQAGIAALTGGASIAPAVAKLGAKLGFNAFRKTGVSTLRNALRGGSTLKAVETGANVGNKIGATLNFGKYVAQSTFFEAGMEARHGLHDSIDQWVSSYYDQYGKAPSVEETERFVKGAETAANGVFWGNVGLLAITNASMFGKAFGLGKISNPISTKMNELLGIGVKKGEKGMLDVIAPNKVQKILGTSYYIGRKPFSEGVVEEGLQGVMGKMAAAYTDAKYNNDETYSFTQNLVDALGEQYGTKEGWNEIGTGMIVGMLGGNIGAVGNKGSLGVEGIGGGKNIETYKRAREEMKGKVAKRNQAVETFRNQNRVNSMFNFSQNQEEGLQNTGLYQDTVTNHSYMKSAYDLKGAMDVVEDYNTVIDSLEIPDADVQSSGLENVAQYKEQMKAQFKEEFKTFEQARAFSERLNLDNVKLNEGNSIELKDALTLSFMMTKKSENEANKIAQNIEAMTGVNGTQSALRFFETINAKQAKNIASLQQKETQLQALMDEIVNIQNNIQGKKAEGADVTEIKTLSKKYSVVNSNITDLQREINSLKDVLNNEFKAISSTDLNTGVNYSNIDNVLDTVKSINTMAESMRKTGRTEDAKVLENSLSQYSVYTQTAIDGKLMLDAMMNSNFFSTKKGKEFTSSVLGEKYSPTDKAIEDIKGIEQELVNKASALGYSVVDGKGLLNLLSENEQLSDREKFKAESILRVVATQKLIEQRAEEAEALFNNTTEEVVEEVTPDSVQTASKLRNTSPNTIEQLRELVDDIANLSDSVTNKPTSAKIAEIKRKKRELELLENAPVEEAPVIVDEVGQTSSGNSKDVVDRVLDSLEFKQISENEFEWVVNTLSETDDYTQNVINLLRNIIDEEKSFETPNEELINIYQDTLNKLVNGEINANDVGEIFKRPTDGQDQSTSEGETKTIPTTNGNNEQISSINATNIRENEQRIEALREEIRDLETPFKFLETPDYKRYKKLLEIDTENITDDQLEELSKLKGDIDNWIKIMGVEIEGISFSDLVEQLVALENVEVVETPPTKNITDEEIDINFDALNKTGNQNLSVALNYGAVTSTRKQNNGIFFTEVSNIRLDELEDITGISLEGRVVVNPITNAVQIPDDVLTEINNSSPLRITMPEQGSITYNSPVRILSQSISGENVFTILPSTFNKEYAPAEVFEEDIHNTEDGDEVLVEFDPNDPYNQEEFLQPLKKELGIMSAIEVEAEVENQIQLYKPQILVKEQQKLLKLKNAKPKNKTKIKDTENRISDILDAQRERIRTRLKGQRKTKVSPELSEKIRTKLKLKVVTKNGENLSTLKGSRETSDIDKSNAVKLQSVRDEFASDINMLLEAIDTPTVITKSLGVKVAQVYPGFPNYNMVANSDGSMVKRSTNIAKNDVKKIDDIGYIEMGEIKTRKGIKKIDTSFVESQVKNKTKDKFPIVVFKQGTRYVAFPVTVSTDTPLVTSDQMRDIMSRDITDVQKAIELNTLLARAGVDVNTVGNSFVVTTGMGINNEFFEDKVAQVENITYLRSVDSFLDKSIPVGDALVGSGASTTIDMSTPFISPKMRLDFDGVRVKETSGVNNDVKENSKSTVVNILTMISPNKQKTC